MVAQVGKPKRAYTPYALDEGLRASVFERAQASLHAILDQPYEKAVRKQRFG